LGLSLVAAIARLHQARLSLEDNAPGLCVVVQFQAARPEECAAEARGAGAAGTACQCNRLAGRFAGLAVLDELGLVGPGQILVSRLFPASCTGRMSGSGVD
jgi:hypothetical protein